MNVDKEKLQNLKDNQIELSYKKLCDYLEIPYYRGCQKDSQLKELATYCKYEKNGTKYTIKEVYENKLLLQDGRALTLPNIEYILLNELSKTKFNGVLFASNKELLKVCYIINNNYYALLSNRNKNSLILAEKYDFDDSFIEYVNKAYDVLKPSLLTALKSMVNRKEIILNTGFKLQKGRFGSFLCVTATEELGVELFKIQGNVMKEMHILRQSDLFGKYAYKKQEYYDRCNDIVKHKSKYDEKWIKNGWDFDRFYQCHAIILNQEKMVYDIEMNKKIKQELNDIVHDKIHNTKMLRNVSYNDIDKWFTICNTKDGDKKYRFSDDISEYYKNINE